MNIEQLLNKLKTLIYSKSEVDTRLNDYIPKSGGGVMTGNFVGRINASLGLTVSGGDEDNHGGSILLLGSSSSYNPGSICLIPNKNGLLNYLWLHPDGTLTWQGTPIQYSSDQRLKQQIAEIDDKLLDAWEDVEPVQFKYNDAVDQKVITQDFILDMLFNK